MDIALPCKVVAIADTERMLVTVAPETGGGREIVSAALVLAPGRLVDELVGAFVLIHAGFVIALIDEAGARLRLQLFAVLGGGAANHDFPIATTEVACAPEPPESGGNADNAYAPLFLQVTRHV
jgi:hydrogenase expression/formation protein HypC